MVIEEGGFVREWEQVTGRCRRKRRSIGKIKQEPETEEWISAVDFVINECDVHH